MLLGVSSFAFTWGVRQGVPPVDEQSLIAFARHHGLDALQLGDNLPVHEMASTRRAALRTAAVEAGLRLELGARGLTRDHLDRYLDLACELDSPLLRFVVDSDGHEPDAAWIIETLRWACPRLEAAKVILALENHDRFGAAELRAMIDAVKSPYIGICLDTANSLGAGEGLEFVTYWLAPVTVNLHVKDVTIRRVPSQMGFVIEGCTLGKGRLPIRHALEQVWTAGRCASVILEAWTSLAGTTAETVQHELSEAEQSLEVLRAWMGSREAERRDRR
ncbi:MAG TPA: sugar phosphate isomerase/epimerase family protein [Verrucomicrobiota bacterium]|nr:hypothetical protein [Verrucomicrobiales bacterium]HRI12233.1 sugar phosphate isomerase/epimerase family protein [Verrucomicrobiota bacterium]